MPESKAIWSVRGCHHASLRPKSRHRRGMSGGSREAVAAAAAPLPADKQLSAQAWLPNQLSIPGAPAGVGAPTLLTGTIMWGTVLVPNVNVDPYFNSRGLPCLPDPITGVCNPTTGFVYYFRYDSSGRTRWTATSISPAGRIQSWDWNGASWGN